jgi:hypothetical protein
MTQQLIGRKKELTAIRSFYCFEFLQEKKAVGTRNDIGR